ncbi:Female germline-specific tumor suppressor gld-1 [Toxocara canis]|uniref:Female germline-specific tumor suppressor gld-1 n=1 Tax=Toxocara canis TaxID=6265 RepID=A0A0B2VUP4_TOXCA|nr:Female germline-specific tumor suppressor gld-1 [Toxocara canis]
MEGPCPYMCEKFPRQITKGCSDLEPRLGHHASVETLRCRIRAVMDTPAAKGYSHFGQPLVKLRKDIEACHLSGDHVTPRKPLFSPRSEQGSSATPEGISTSDYTTEYLADLIREKRQLEIFQQFFPNIERLMDEEITRVRMVLFDYSFSIEKVNLPEPEGDPITVQEKVYMPCKEHPDYNFVGRLLGPRGMTAKQLEQETGCKIMVRGRGSMRDRRNEELKRGKPNWEHLDDDLHVIVQCEDTPNRVYPKLKICVEQIKKLLVPGREGADDLKRKQLMELAIFSGTYRPGKREGADDLKRKQLMELAIFSGTYRPGKQRMLTLVSPIRQPQSSLPPQPIFVSPVGSPITPANNIGSAPAMNSFTQSSKIDYSVLMNQLPFDGAALRSLSMGNGDYQPQSSAFVAATPLISAAQPYYLVMELVHGGSVDDYLKKKGSKISVTARTQILYEASVGLDYLHSKSCLHRDVACRNLLIDKVVKVADFGMTRHTTNYKIDPNKQMNLRWLAPEVFDRVVNNGYRLKPPELMPRKIGNLMEECIGAEESQPTFSVVVVCLKISVDLSTAEMVGAIRDTMDQLNMMWDEIEMEEAERVTRYHALKKERASLKSLVKDRLKGQREMVDEIYSVAVRLGKEVGEMPGVESGVWDNETLTIVQRRSAEMNAELTELLDRASQWQTDLRRWCSQMGSQWGTDSVRQFANVALDDAHLVLDAAFMEEFSEAHSLAMISYNEWLQQAQLDYQRAASKLEELWELYHVPDGERHLVAAFNPTTSTATDIENIKREVRKLERFLEERLKIYDKIREWKDLWAEKIGYESRANDVKTYINRGGRLQQILQRQRYIAARIPTVLNELKVEAEKYNAAHEPQDAFLIDGQPPWKHIEWIMSEYKAHKELQRRHKKQVACGTTSTTRNMKVANGVSSTPTYTTQQTPRSHFTPRHNSSRELEYCTPIRSRTPAFDAPTSSAASVFSQKTGPATLSPNAVSVPFSPPRSAQKNSEIGSTADFCSRASGPSSPH